MSPHPYFTTSKAAPQRRIFIWDGKKIILDIDWAGFNSAQVKLVYFYKLPELWEARKNTNPQQGVSWQSTAALSRKLPRISLRSISPGLRHRLPSHRHLSFASVANLGSPVTSSFRAWPRASAQWTLSGLGSWAQSFGGRRSDGSWDIFRTHLCHHANFLPRALSMIQPASHITVLLTTSS